MSHSRIRAFAIAVTMAALGLVGLSPAGLSPAHADSYRYWSYYIGNDSWEFAQSGPATRTLQDRAVDGWKFGVFGADGGSAPSESTDFATLCPALEAAGPASGQIRVAVVLDAGVASDAPAGETPFAATVECVLLPSGANGYQALAKAAEVRAKDGMVCGINGYPASECATQIADSASPTPEPSAKAAAKPSSSAPSQLWLAASLVLLLAGGITLVLAARRRR